MILQWGRRNEVAAKKKMFVHSFLGLRETANFPHCSLSDAGNVKCCCRWFCPVVNCQSPNLWSASGKGAWWVHLPPGRQHTRIVHFRVVCTQHTSTSILGLASPRWLEMICCWSKDMHTSLHTGLQCFTFSPLFTRRTLTRKFELASKHKDSQLPQPRKNCPLLPPLFEG